MSKHGLRFDRLLHLDAYRLAQWTRADARHGIAQHLALAKHAASIVHGNARLGAVYAFVIAVVENRSAGKPDVGNRNWHWFVLWIAEKISLGRELTRFNAN